MAKLQVGDTIPVSRDESDESFQSGITNIRDYLKSRRKQQRVKARFNRPEKFFDIYQKPDSKFTLTPEELEWFYPVSKDKPDWEYSDDTTESAVEADKAFLDSILPTKYPEDSYFEEQELPYLLSMNTPLRYPPIHFIRKFNI